MTYNEQAKARQLRAALKTMKRGLALVQCALLDVHESFRERDPLSMGLAREQLNRALQKAARK